MAEKTVMTVHKVTGILSEVPESYLELFPGVLEKASDKQIKAAQTKLETEIYGHPLKDGVIPVDPVEPSVSGTNEGGTA